MSTAQAGNFTSAKLGSPGNQDGIARGQKKQPRDIWPGILRENKSTIRKIFVTGRPVGQEYSSRSHLHAPYSIVALGGYAGLS